MFLVLLVSLIPREEKYYHNYFHVFRKYSTIRATRFETHVQFLCFYFKKELLIVYNRYAER